MVAGSRIKLKDNASLFIDEIHTWPKEAYFINQGCMYDIATQEYVYKSPKNMMLAYEEIHKPEIIECKCILIDHKPWAYIASNDYFTEIRPYDI